MPSEKKLCGFPADVVLDSSVGVSIRNNKLPGLVFVAACGRQAVDGREDLRHRFRRGLQSAQLTGSQCFLLPWIRIDRG